MADTTLGNPKQAAALLRQAAALVNEARGLLDIKDQGCSTCGRHHWRNVQHAKIYEALGKSAPALALHATKLEAEVQRQQAALTAKGE
jgi:hypothetical protein